MGLRNITFSQDEYYHVYNRGVEKRKIFIDKGDHERFVKLLYTANSTLPVHLSNYQSKALIEIPKGEPLVAVGAWCLMPNHFHILVKEVANNGLSNFMQKMLTGYSKYFNTKYHRKGKLFEDKFYAKHLNFDEYLKYQYAYIHLNPIGIIDSGWKNKQIVDKSKAKDFLETYKYSSFWDYMGNERQEGLILKKDLFPEYFNSITDFDAMINEWMNFDGEEISKQGFDK